MAALVVLFVVVPIVELFVIVKVASHIGALNTIGALILVSMVGAWLVKHQGLGVLRRMQGQLDRRQLPTTELVEGVVVLAAGALLLTPGFVTDALGLVLLLPPVRRVAALLVRRRMQPGRTRTRARIRVVDTSSVYNATVSDDRRSPGVPALPPPETDREPDA